MTRPYVPARSASSTITTGEERTDVNPARVTAAPDEARAHADARGRQSRPEGASFAAIEALASLISSTCSLDINNV